MGSIPGEAFEGLDSLQYIDVSGNTYSTMLPDELLALPDLSYLYVQHVEFENLTFTLDFMAEMPKIVECWVDSTPISGGIPTELGNVLSLVSFSASSCGLDGAIPTEIGNLIFLERLWLYNNELTGSIPTEMGNLGRLELLFTDGNMLSGSMPEEVCELSTPTNVISIGVDCQSDATAVVDCACCTCCGPTACSTSSQ